MSDIPISRHEMAKTELVYFGPSSPLPIPFDELEALHGDEQQLHFLQGAKAILLEACASGLIEEPSEGHYPLSLLLDQVGATLAEPETDEQRALRERLDCVLFLSDCFAVRRLHRDQGIDVTFRQSEHRDYGFPEFSCYEWGELQTATLNAL